MRAIRTPFTPVYAHGDHIVTLCVLAKENYLATAGEREFALWQLPTMSIRAREDITTGEGTILGYSAKRGLLMLASISTGRLAAIEIRTGKEVDHDLPSNDENGAIVFSPDGVLVALYTDAQNGQVWEWGTKNAPVTLQNCIRAYDYAFSHDSHFVATEQGGMLVIWEAFSGRHWHSIAEPASCYCFGPDRSIAIGKSSGEVVYYQYDGRYWRHVWSERLGGTVYEVVMAPRADPRTQPLVSTLACLTETDVTILDIKSGKRCGTLYPETETLRRLAVSPEHNRVIAAADYGCLLAWTA